VCTETGLLATQACPSVTTEVFNEGSEPADYCTSHPGRPIRTHPTTLAPAPGPEVGKPDLRDLDRTDRARSREKIRTW
jgi:hypothetical protein